MTQPILFDMDGVVLEGRGTHPTVYDRAADAALTELGLEPDERRRAALREYEYESVERACTALGVDPARFWQLKERHASRLCHDRLRAGERGVYDDVAAIDALAAETTLALVSNNRHETVSFVADHFELPFDLVRGRDPTPEGFRRRKPRPDYLEETLERLDEDGGLYVGDRETDVVAASRAGLEAAYLRRPHNADTTCPDGAIELESLSELLERR